MDKTPQQIWDEIPIGNFFTLKGDVYKKIGGTLAQHVTNSILGQRQILPQEYAGVAPYDPQNAPKVGEERFDIRYAPHAKAPRADFGAGDVKITSADSPTETAPGPETKTGE